MHQPVPVAAVISGEAGIGKSRLTDAMVDAATQRDMWTLVGRCIASGGEILPAAAVRDLVIDMSGIASQDLGATLEQGGLGRLLPGGEHAEPLPAARLVDLVLGALRSLTAERPVLVVIEDLHWADDTTRRLVSALATTRWLGAVTVAVTFRHDELHRRHPVLPVVEEIIRAVRPLRIELDPLTGDAVQELIGHLRPDPVGSATGDDIFRRTGGNPFLIEELLGSPEPGTVTDTLRSVLVARIAPLGDTALHLLQIAALAGRIRPDTLASACDLEEGAAAELIDELTDAAILVDDGTHLSFRHDLAREVFAESAPGRRTDLHTALAAALTDKESDRLGDIAHHWLAAHDQPRALTAAIEAADEALAVGAAPEALELLRTAVDLWPRVDDAERLTGTDLPGVLLQAAHVALHTCRLDDGTHDAERALSLLGDDRAREIDALLLLRNLYRYGTRWGDCSRVVDRLLHVVPTEPPTVERALTLTYAALERYYDGTDGDPLAREAVAVAEATGDLGAIIETRSIELIWVPLDRRVRVAENVVGLVDHTVSAERALRAYNSLCISQAVSGDFRAFTATAMRARELAEHSGLPGGHGASMSGYVVLGHFLLGEWDRALAESNETSGRTNEVIAHRQLIAHRRGEPLDREAIARRLLTQRDQDVWKDYGLGDWAEIFLEVCPPETGDRVVDLAVELFELPTSAEEKIMAEIVDAVVAALHEHAERLPRDERREATARWMQRLRPWTDHVERLDIDTIAAPQPRASALRARAGLAALRGASGPEAWLTAAGAFADLEMAYDEAAARLRAAQALLAGTDGRSVAAHDAAAVEVERAEELARRVGATLLSEEIAALRRTANLDAHTSAPAIERSEEQASGNDPGASADSYGLTNREREILTLVAAGRSNGEIGKQLFISTKTASSHVSNILRKLGVTNRVEAATLGQRHHLLLDDGSADGDQSPQASPNRSR